MATWLSVDCAGDARLVGNASVGSDGGRFKEMAQDWQDLAAVRDFLAALRSLDIDPELEIDHRKLKDWLSWVEDWLQRADLTTNGIEGVCRQVAAIQEWSYRDQGSEFGLTAVNGLRGA